jgi:hypothetical protein
MILSGNIGKAVRCSTRPVFRGIIKFLSKRKLQKVVARGVIPFKIMMDPYFPPPFNSTKW